MGWFSGSKGKFKSVSTLDDNQQSLLNQLLAVLSGQESGGAFGDISNYYRDLLSNDSETFNQMASPEMRRFNEEIIPDLAEQFAGMGSGGLSSSGFRNAAVSAGTDLSERLGALRAQLRQQGVQGLQGLSQMGLNQYKENVYQPSTPGFGQSFGQGFGQGLGQGLGKAAFGGGSSAPIPPGVG